MPAVHKTRGLLGADNAIIIGLPSSFDLHRELAKATEIRLATAFAHLSGWKLIRPELARTKAKVRLLTGLSFCQTEPAVLKDWLGLSESVRCNVSARIFADKQVTFHPKVLIATSPSRSFAVIGSGNLSAGGLRNNIECGYFVSDSPSVAGVTKWFDELFDSDRQTKQLQESDIKRYAPLFKKAQKANKSVRNLQHAAEEDIGDRHRASLNNWK